MSRPRLGAIESQRLWLVPASVDLVQADLDGAAALAAALGVAVPEDWPPEHQSRASLAAVMARLGDRAEHGWSRWYLVGKGAGEGLVGLAGFEGRPDAEGQAEIAYSIVPSHRSRGYATEAVERLVAWAFSHDRVREVTAETLPHLRPSIRVLEKNGFRQQGQGGEYGMVRWVVGRRTMR